MSELTSCNYCNLKALKRNTKENEILVRLNGNEFYRHPKIVDFKKLSDKEKQKYWIAWMMEITDHCVC